MGKEKIKLHVMMEIVSECISWPFSNYIQLDEENIDHTQEYDKNGTITENSKDQVFQSRVSILESTLDENNNKCFNVDISIHDLLETKHILSVNGGFLVHQVNGISEVSIKVTICKN